MNIVQEESVVDTSDLQIELERMKERFENCIIKKETEYAKLWNDWYKKCNECKYDKISYDKSYKDMQQKIERLQAQLGDLKGKCKDTSHVSDTRNPLSQKLENKNVELESQASDHKDNTQNTSANTKFAKQPIGENFPKVGKTNALSKPVTSNSVSTPQVSKGVNNDKVIAPGMFRINPSKTSRNKKHVLNTVSVSTRTKLITVSQTHGITKKDVNSDLNGLSSTGVDNTKTRRPKDQSLGAIQSMIGSLMRLRVDVISKVVCAMCKKYLISVNHDKCLRIYVNGKIPRGKKQTAKVSVKEIQKNYQPKIAKPKKIRTRESLATPKPSKSRFILRWSPTGKLFDTGGKIVDYSESKSTSNCSNGDNACTSNTMEPKIKRFPNSTSLLGRLSRFVCGTSTQVIQICLWCVDSVCSKHMTGNLKLLINFVWKFMGTVRFENDHVAAILGFGDLQWGNILISRVYFVEGLGHNLFSVGQFCDSDLEVAFRRDACFVRNLEGVDLLKGDRSTNLFKINLNEIASASPICLMTRASSTKSWLWHQRLSHLNFDTINDLAKNDLVAGLPKFKYHKEHLCPFYEQGKSKRASHPPKPVPNSRQRLNLLHMDLCGPMRIASINGKRYVLVIVDDYSRYTWVHFLRSKDEAPENQVLKEYFDTVGISHQMSSVRTPQQNGVVERRNRTLVEAARTMLIFSRAPLFLWAEVIATTCFTQNRSIIHRRFNKTPYELINGQKPNISFLHVFGALCYPKNDLEDIGKLGAKCDIGFFIGYFADSCAYRIYNRRTKKIIETMNVSFDELSAMAFKQRSLKPGLNSMTSGHISSRLDLTYAP
nr:retrovirus-related Pol polyprotein from transposon TNT 1-94 [Tanacetum cinerariifolium]